MDNKRLSSVDTLRSIAIWAVIFLHAHYFYWSGPNSADWTQPPLWFLNEICNYAVPYFFIVAGYFFEKSCSKDNNPAQTYLRYMQRLLIAFVGWSVIYSFVWFPYKNQTALIKHYGLLHAYYWFIHNSYLTHPVMLCLSGTSGHLWFISTLMQSLTLIFLLNQFKNCRLVIYITLLLYVFSPIENMYLPQPGPSNPDWDPTANVFTSAPAVVIGWWLAKQKNLKPGAAYLLLAVGVALLLGKFTAHLCHLKLHYLDMDAIMAMSGLFMLALLNPKWGESTVLPALGRMTLGIYCVHPLIMHYLAVFKGLSAQCLWNIPLLLLTYLLSVGVVLILKPIPLTRKLVI